MHIPKLHLRKKTKHPDAQSDKHSMVVRLFIILSLGLFITIIMGFSFYLYQAVFGTIGEVRILILSKENLTIETIDFGKLEKVKAAWAQKSNIEGLPNIRNPFVAVSTPTDQEVPEQQIKAPDNNPGEHPPSSDQTVSDQL